MKRLGFSPYIGMGNNPIRLADPDGGGPDDIIIKGTNNSSLTIITAVVANLEVNYDFWGNIVRDASRVFIGFDTGISGNASVFLKMDGIISIMSGMFLGGEYAFYPYDFLVGQMGHNLSRPEISASGFKNVVIGYYKGDMAEYHPSTFTGAFEYLGASLTTPWLAVGFNGQWSSTPQWDIWELGITYGVATSILPWSSQIKSNMHLPGIVGDPAGPGTNAWLLNRNVQPTADRDLSSILIAPFVPPGLR